MNSEEFEKPVEFQDYFKQIWKRKRIVIVLALGVLGVSLWHTLRTEPLYEAEATMQLVAPSAPGRLLDPLALTASNILGLSEIEIIKSRFVAERAAVKAQRHYELLPLPPGLSLQVSHVEVGSNSIPGVYTITFIDATSYRVVNPQGRFVGVGRTGQPFGTEGASFTISSAGAKSGDSVRILLHPLRSVAEALQAKFSVVPIKNTNLVTLSARANDPQEAARVANAFADSYAEFTREQKVRHLSNMRGFLEKQIDVFRKDILDMKQALAQKALQKTGPESVMEYVIRMPEAPGYASRLTSPKQTLVQRLFDLELTRATLLYQYGPDHNVIRRIDSEIGDLRNRLVKQFKGEKQNIPVHDLAIELQLKLSTYNSMIQKQYEVQLAEIGESPSVGVIDRALPPEFPIEPSVTKNLLIGSALGLSLGVALALFLGYLDQSVKDVKDLEDRVGLPAFGVIPEILGESRGIKRWLSRERRDDLPDLRRCLVGFDGVGSRTVEAYRSLRTNIQFAIPEAPTRAFLITSPGPGEGKSLTVANLAISMSQMERRVLLVDADLRRPVQEKYFALPRDTGLTNLLAKNLSWRDVIRPVHTAADRKIDVISGGPLPPNPAELLSGQTFGVFLEEAKQEYDVVLIDSPPVLIYTDACVLAPLVNGVFLVVRAGVTDPEAILRAQSLLGAVNGKVVGAILNAVPHDDGFGYYRYYDYHYADDERSDGEGWRRLRRATRRILSHIRKI